MYISFQINGFVLGIDFLVIMRVLILHFHEIFILLSLEMSYQTLQLTVNEGLFLTKPHQHWLFPVFLIYIILSQVNFYLVHILILIFL